MSDIQYARDVLGNWRSGVIVVTSIHDLIEGTAGNPDLLDALDGILAEAAADIMQYGNQPADLWNGHRRLAAAIIAADERMDT